MFYSIGPWFDCHCILFLGLATKYLQTFEMALKPFKDLEILAGKSSF
jgi:hypothetical protein